MAGSRRFPVAWFLLILSFFSFFVDGYTQVSQAQPLPEGSFKSETNPERSLLIKRPRRRLVDGQTLQSVHPVSGLPVYYSRRREKRCNTGRYMKNNKCSSCTAGRFQDENSVNDPNRGSRSRRRTGLANTGVCHSCQPGRYGGTTTGRKVRCTQCAIGQFQNDEGKTTCKTCPEGKFAGAIGATICTGT